MQALMQSTPSLAGRLAEDLLKAWLSGDELDVHAQLERSVSVSSEVDDTNEQERRQLLKAVAVRMSERDDLLDHRGESPQLELYIHLLGHMVS
jgi:hypothetical protein